MRLRYTGNAHLLIETGNTIVRLEHGDEIDAGELPNDWAEALLERDDVAIADDHLGED